MKYKYDYVTLIEEKERFRGGEFFKIDNTYVALLVKNWPAMQETWVDPWVGKIAWRSEWLPTPVFWPGESMDCIVHGAAKSQT